jgi:hypothetical protein
MIRNIEKTDLHCIRELSPINSEYTENSEIDYENSLILIDDTANDILSFVVCSTKSKTPKIIEKKFGSEGQTIEVIDLYIKQDEKSCEYLEFMMNELYKGWFVIGKQFWMNYHKEIRKYFSKGMHLNILVQKTFHRLDKENKKIDKIKYFTFW